ncbi:MAG: GGDEF domain-containing protein [Candidatus Omnitrophica bacterium]|nr:GGDEF domain-containing protein [Candidatus Omnitrophota bacterium]
MAVSIGMKKFIFLMAFFMGAVLLSQSLATKAAQKLFSLDYLTASCASGAAIVIVLSILARFNKAIEKQISNFLSITDSLTGLYDHKYLMRRLGEEIERSKRYLRPLSLLMLDIDRFKNYNDSFGHQAGDAILIELARMFKVSCRKIDIIARYGGEEFAVIMPEIKKENALALAERLRKKAEEMKVRGDRKVTLSVGAGFFDGFSTDFTKENFIKMADEALYRAKTKGRNRVET